MGLTIGALRELRGLRPGVRRRRHGAVCTAVAEYTGRWGWDVLPGARAVRGSGGSVRCSCGDGACPVPGAHPLDESAVVRAGATLAEAARVWQSFPRAGLMLPVGRSFDVLEVAREAGQRALVRLERMGVPLGPVAAAPHGRTWYLVAPGAAAELPGLLYRMGWDDPALDLRALGCGDHITAPPSEHGGWGPVGWLRPPTPESVARLPEARLLLGTLAYEALRLSRRARAEGVRS